MPSRIQPSKWVVLGIGILCAPQFAVLTFATVCLHDLAHLGIGVISGTMVVVQLGAMVMRVWSGRFTDRRGDRRAYLRGSTLVAVMSFFALASAVAAVFEIGLPGRGGVGWGSASGAG
jgi:predicted MFS family arabinose efflux permease